MKDFPQQLSGIEVVWVPLIRLPFRYDVPTNQDGPGGLLRQQQTVFPGPRRTIKEFD